MSTFLHESKPEESLYKLQQAGARGSGLQLALRGLSKGLSPVNSTCQPLPYAQSVNAATTNHDVNDFYMDPLSDLI